MCSYRITGLGKCGPIQAKERLRLQSYCELVDLIVRISADMQETYFPPKGRYGSTHMIKYRCICIL